MDRLAAMRTFVEIVDRGSLTAAADALNRSQPAVVRMLAALEKHLGAMLLRRTTRRMSLTPEGRDFLERCRTILADVEEAELAIGQAIEEPRGSIRMTGPVEFGRLHLTPAVTDFLRRFEQVRVDLMLLDRNVDLVNEGIDLAFRIGPLADSSMIAIPVGEVRRIIVASPALLQRTGVPKYPSDLTGLPCIRQQNIPRRQTHWPFADGTKEITVEVDGRLGVNQVAAAASACVNDAGFGQFFSYQVDELIRGGQLTIVLEDHEPPPWPMSLVYPGGRLVTTRLRALIEWLKDALAKRACANRNPPA